MNTKSKLVPIEPTREMWAAAGDAVVALNSQHHDAISAAVYKAMLTAAPTVEPEEFCEDTALSLAERTFSTEIDEQLAEDVIQYARRLHSRYTAQQPAPEVEKLVEALEGLLSIVSDSSGVAGYHLNGDIAHWGEFEEVATSEEALASYRQQVGDV